MFYVLYVAILSIVLSTNRYNIIPIIFCLLTFPQKKKVCIACINLCDLRFA